MSWIHQEELFSASPADVYAALMDPEKHGAFTGAPAENDAVDGGAWSSYGGAISGRNIELAAGTRIVQAWRAGNWPAGVYSLVRFEFAAEGTGTRLVLDHSGYPEDAGVHLEQGWHDRYWSPLRTYLEA